MSSSTRFFDTVLKNVPLSTFSGTGSENVHDWLKRIEKYFDALNATSAQRVVATELLLRDNASRWANNRPATPEGVDTWVHFKECIRQRFESPNAKFFARSRLYNLKQTGSVSSYIADFDNLRSILSDFGEADAIQVFLNGLTPRIQEHFAGNPTLRTDLNTVMQIAESLDSVHRREQTIFHAPRTVTSSQERTTEPMELDAFHQSRQWRPRRPNFNQDQKKVDLRNRTCFKCHSPQHQYRSCPQNPKNQSGKVSSQ